MHQQRLAFMSQRYKNPAKFRGSLIISVFNINMFCYCCPLAMSDFSGCHFILSFFTLFFICLLVLTLPISSPILNSSSVLSLGTKCCHGSQSFEHFLEYLQRQVIALGKQQSDVRGPEIRSSEKITKFQEVFILLNVILVVAFI